MSKKSFFVVIDPTKENQPALERAIQSAKMANAKLHLFQCIYHTYVSSPDLDQVAIEEKFLGKLQSYVDRVLKENIEVSHEQVWDKNWRQAITSAADKLESLMIFKPSYIHTRAERSEETADWTLLRNCCRPVMLIHNNTRWEKRIVLAAVNLTAEDKLHQKLNDNIINVASSLRSTYDADVHFVNAISAPETAKQIDDDDLMIANSWPGMKTRSVPKAALTPASVAQRCGVDEDHVHLCIGASVDTILSKAKQLGADLILVGTVARGGIRARLLGNTAERLLDDAECDILTLSVSNTSLE